MQLRIEPFFVTAPDKYKPPPFKPSGSGWDLDPGYYVLTIQPVQKGVVSMAIYPARMLSVAQSKLAKPDELTKAPLQAAARFGVVTFEQKRNYWLYFNRQPEVSTGLVLRKLPLDLTDALPLALEPGESAQVPFVAAEDGILGVETEDGSKLEVSVDQGGSQPAASVAAGKHSATVRNAGSETVIGSLVLEPRRLQADTPLPPLPETALESMPRFPVLTETGPQSFDLAERGHATFVVRADQPALYALQTTGLLATDGNLRTRTVPSLFHETQNGVGRNFLIQQYLREGTYQVTVSAQEPMHGHLGLQLRRTELVDGGELTEGAPARIELPAGAAVAYRFTIAETRDYHLQSLGLGRTFRCRLEDDAGWPIAEPDAEADMTRTFEPGSYRLILLPGATASRRVTLLQRVPPALSFEGHGPHRLPLAQRVEHRWMEPAEGAPRTPDAWDIQMPAPANVTIELTGEMEARLVRGSPPVEVATLPAGKPWQGRLEAGSYEIQAVCARINNNVDYTVEVRLDELIAGQTLDVRAPASVPVSVGRDGLIELSSFGSADVRARAVRLGRRASCRERRPARGLELPAAAAAGVRGVPAAGRPGRGREGLVLGDDAGSRREARGVADAAGEHRCRARPGGAGVSDRAAARGSTAGGRRAVQSRRSAARWKRRQAAAGAPWPVSWAMRPGSRCPLAAGGARRYRLRLWSLDRRGTGIRVLAASAQPSPVAEAAVAEGYLSRRSRGSSRRWAWWRSRWTGRGYCGCRATRPGCASRVRPTCRAGRRRWGWSRGGTCCGWLASFRPIRPHPGSRPDV